MGDATSSAVNAEKHFYDRISKAYDFISDSSEHRAREIGLELLAAAPGESVLEIGFGTGHSLVSLAQAVGETGRVVGLDISDGMRDVAARRLKDEGLAERVQLDLGDASSLSYGDNEFDAVYTSFTLELFPLDKIPQVLAEVRRVLKPGGRLAVVSMAAREHAGLLTDIYKWLHRHFPHFIDCQPIDAAGLVQDAGFQLGERKDMEIWTLPVVQLVATNP